MRRRTMLRKQLVDLLLGTITLAVAGALVVLVILSVPRYIDALDGRISPQTTVAEAVR